MRQHRADGVGHYIFVVTPERGAQGAVARPARDVVADRATVGRWPLGTTRAYAGRFAAGDKIVFYAAGAGDPDRSCFIAIGTVGGPPATRPRDLQGGVTQFAAAGWKDTGRYLPIQDVEPIPRVRIHQLTPHLRFIGDKTHWSLHLAGAFHRIPQEDWELISRAAVGDEFESS